MLRWRDGGGSGGGSWSLPSILRYLDLKPRRGIAASSWNSHQFLSPKAQRLRYSRPNESGTVSRRISLWRESPRRGLSTMLRIGADRLRGCRHYCPAEPAQWDGRAKSPIPWRRRWETHPFAGQGGWKSPSAGFWKPKRGSVVGSLENHSHALSDRWQTDQGSDPRQGGAKVDAEHRGKSLQLLDHRLPSVGRPSICRWS